MKVFTLVGGWDYEGLTLLGVFGSREDLLAFVESRKRGGLMTDTLGYDSLGVVESELGQPIDFHAMVDWGFVRTKI